MKPIDDHDPYALYVRAHRHHCMTWVGPEPKDAVGQLALSIGKRDGYASGWVFKNRAELMVEIAKLNVEPIGYYRPRIRPRRRKSR